jgi:multiple sugar transport system ATP-binding protein
VAANLSGRDVVIAGIRPEHFEDARLVSNGRDRGVTFRAQVDVIEWLGAEQYAYIPFEAPPEVHQPLRELAAELDSEPMEMRTQLVVSLDAASRITEHSEAELWLDAARVHLFDPQTGDNLGDDVTDGKDSGNGSNNGSQ